MSQPPSHGSYSNSSSSNHLGSYDVISGQYYQEYAQPVSQAQSYAPRERSIPSTESTALYNYPNLPPETKLPPSYHAGSHVQGGDFRPQPVPRTTLSGANNSMEQHSGQIPTSEIIKQLDFAASENVRLRQRLEDNNRVLEEKMGEIAQCLSSKDTEKQELLKKYEDATNKFFEARVAVLGFKCRTMQLQGELETLKKRNGVVPVPVQQSPDPTQYQRELDWLRKENQALQEQLKVGGGGGGQGAARNAQSLQQQLERLQMEKSGIHAEKINLEGVIKELMRDIQGLENKRSLDQDEIKHVVQMRQALEAQVAQLEQANMAVREEAMQQQSYLQHELDRLQVQSPQVQPNFQELEEARSANTVMMGQIYQLQEDIKQRKALKLDMERKLSTLLQEKELLGRKVQEMEKKQKYSGGVTPPVPKPRTNIQAFAVQIEHLQKEVEELQSQKEKVENDLRNESKHRRTSEQLHQEEIRKSEEQKMKIARLQADLETGATNLREKQSLQTQVQQLQQQLAAVHITQQANQKKDERIRELEGMCGSLEKASHDEREAKKKFQADLMASKNEVDRLKREVRALQPPPSAVGREEPAPAGKRLKSPEVRLNDAMKENKELKNRIAEKDKQLEELDNEKEWLQKQLMDKEAIEQQLTEESEKAVRSAHKTIEDLKQQKSSVEDELSQAVHGKVEVQNKLDECRQDLTQLQDEGQALRSQLAAKGEDVARLQQRISDIQQRKNHTEHQLQTKHQEVEELQGTVEQQGIELQSIRSQCVQEEAQRLALQTEQNDAQLALGEYKNECEALMGDYQTCAERLRETEEERDRHKKQVEIGLRELTKRADKIKQLEAQRTELTERGQHMDFQLKTYMDDFNRERKSREDLAEAIKHLERKNSDLLREKQELISRVNIQAQKALQDDEDTPPVPGRRSPYQPGMGGGGLPPNSGAGGIPLGAVGRQSSGSPFGGQETPGMGGMVPSQPRQFSREMDQQYKRSGDQHAARAQIIPPQPVAAYPGTLPPLRPPSDMGPPGGHPGDRPPFRPLLDTGPPGGHPGDRPPLRPPLDVRPPLPAAAHFGGHLGNRPAFNPVIDGRAQVLPPRPTMEHPHVPPTGILPPTGVLPPGDRFSRPLPGGPTNMLAGQPVRPHPSPPNDLNIGPPASVGMRRPVPGAVGIRPLVPASVAPQDAERWVAPGEVPNLNTPIMPCPMCHRNNFKTVTDLEIHSAQCTG